MRVTIHYFKLKGYLTANGYAEHEARSVIRKVRRMAPEIKKPFFLWFLREVLPEVVVEDVSFAELTGQWKMNPVNAFLTLDWLLREPERAKSALRRPVDHVVISNGERLKILNSAPEENGPGQEDTGDLTLEE